MRKIFTILLIAAVAAVAGDAVKAKTYRISFANETAAKADTLNTLDSAFCVIPVFGPGGVMPQKITLHLPNLLASGDSAVVFVQSLPRDNGVVNNTKISGDNVFTKLGDNKRVESAKGTANVYRSFQIGTYYHGDGARELSWSPADSGQTARAQIVLIETAGAPVITGMDSLDTSPVYLTKQYKAFND